MQINWSLLASSGVNLYDFAVISSEGVEVHRFQPHSNCADSYSIAKAFVMTSVGLLYDDGKIRPEDRISALIDVPHDSDWRNVTVAHLLTHRAGLDSPFLDIDSDDLSAYLTNDYLAMLLHQPLPYAPGSHFQYSDGVFYLLARIVESICGQPVDALLAKRLLIPMGFGETAWSRCPMGHPIGGTGLYARAEDLAKLAWLYSKGGQWQGQQLLSAEWVHRAVSHGYELHPFDGTSWIGKGGMYGQCMAFSPSKHKAVAWHAFETNGNDGKLLALLDSVF